jgi:hypothetical protein
MSEHLTMSLLRRRVWLSARELTYLKNATFLPAPLLKIIERADTVDRRYQLDVPSEIAEEFRSAFTKHLAEVGFDTAYEPTREGVLLEELIDRFGAT